MNCQSQTVNKDEGFTLIEVLISLFIFAIISVGTMVALTQSLQGKARLQEAVKGINDINAARAIIRSDMNALTLRPMRDELGGTLPYSLTTDGEPLLTFTRRGYQNPGGLERRGDLERVEYYFDKTKLIRRSYQHENPGSDPKFFERILLDNLNDVKLDVMGFQLDRVVPLLEVRFGSDETTNDGLAGNALRLQITDRFDEMTAHYFEFSS